MKILVTVASKHGATAEIGSIVARLLEDSGHEVESKAPQEVPALDGYEAVVLGSAVYAGHWLEAARTFADRHAAALAARPVWLFSSGPIGDPPKPQDEAPEGVALASRLGARGHQTFGGRLERSHLNFLERTVTKAMRAPQGDFRDWEDVMAWSQAIVSELARDKVRA